MDSYAQKVVPPDLIVALGDNFYPYGVQGVNDIQFENGWKQVFLKYASLRVPWFVTLGNHDYRGDWRAQIDYMNMPMSLGLWNMPSQSYHVQVPVGQPQEGNNHRKPTASFFCLDTNGAHKHRKTKRVKEPLMKALEDDLPFLVDDLEASLKKHEDSDFKIVFGHHPCYTKGKVHGMAGDCLSKVHKLDDRFAAHHVNLYLSGHEHMFQYNRQGTTHHIVAGACGSKTNDFYGGEDEARKLTWVDPTLKQFGFVAVTLSIDYPANTKTIDIKYLNQLLDVIYHVTETLSLSDGDSE